MAPVTAQVMMTLDMQNFQAARKTLRVTTARMLQIQALHGTRVNPWLLAQKWKNCRPRYRGPAQRQAVLTSPPQDNFSLPLVGTAPKLEFSLSWSFR
jgi:hypothetical protein